MCRCMVNMHVYSKLNYSVADQPKRGQSLRNKSLSLLVWDFPVGMTRGQPCPGGSCSALDLDTRAWLLMGNTWEVLKVTMAGFPTPKQSESLEVLQTLYSQASLSDIVSKNSTNHGWTIQENNPRSILKVKLAFATYQVLHWNLQK